MRINLGWTELECLDNCFLIGGDFLTEIGASKTLKWMTVGKLYPKKDRDVRTL